MRGEMHGSARLADGTRVALSAAECQAIWDSVEAADAKRAVDMPDVQSAIRAMMDAFTRLKDLGWNDAMYCPKDGSSFDVIEPGSTGIHRCHYFGTWPDGYFMMGAGEDYGPGHPILFRLDPEAEVARKAKMAAAIVKCHAEDAA